jgi:tetratricopeptide (TPR) repeat protein
VTSERGAAGVTVLRRRRRRRAAALAVMLLALTAASVATGQSLWDDPAFALYRQAVEALDARDYTRANALAAEAIKAYPNLLLAYYVRGQAALAQQRWEDAAAAFRKVTELYPESFAGQRDLGAALQQAGRLDEAARAFEAALKLRPDHEDTQVRLALLLVKAKQPERALPLLQALVNRGTKAPDVYTTLARLAYEKEDFAGSEAAFVKALAMRDDGKMWFNLGVVRVRRNDLTGALQAFEHAAQHAETKEQAAREIEKVKAALRK